LPNVAERLRVRLPWRSASTRLIMLYGALFVVWGTALIGFINWETRCYLGRIVDQIVEQRMLYLTGVGRDKLPEAMVAAGALDLRGYTQVGLFDRNHGLITGNLLVRPPGLPSDGHIHDVVDTVKRIDGSVIPHMRGVAQSLAGGEELVLVRDAGVVDRVGVIIGRSLLWGLSLTIIPGIVGGLLLARGPRRRIEQIREATERVIGGELSRRLPVSGRGDELDMLASIVNRMLVEIERLMADKDEALTAAGPVSLQKAKADALDDAWAEIRRLEGERNEALTSNAWWQEEWRLARSERDEALKDAHARMLACEALGVTLDSERKAWEAERARLQEALRSIASHGTTRPWAPGAWDDGDGYWRQVTHALIAAAADALDEREVPTK